MNYLKKTIALSTLVVSATLISSEVNAQCKGFTKRNCMQELSPYLSNGQFNGAYMIPGESADVKINFNQGLSYRLIICADPFLENLNYTLKDDKGVIYLNDTLKETTGFTDLEVTQSKPMTLSISVPEKENTTGIVRNGCVSVLIGFKEIE